MATGKTHGPTAEHIGISVLVPVASLIESASTLPLPSIYEVTKKFQAPVHFCGFLELYYKVCLSTGSLEQPYIYRTAAF